MQTTMRVTRLGTMDELCSGWREEDFQTFAQLLHRASADDMARIFKMANDHSRHTVQTYNRVSLAVGARVKVVNIRPKYLAGRTGTVTNISETRDTITVVLDSTIYEGRHFNVKELTVPMSCLQLLTNS